MDKRELSKLVRAAGRMLLALGFVFSQTAWAAQNQDPKQNPAPASKTSAQQASVKPLASAPTKGESEEAETTSRQNAVGETTSRGGPHEGIKVHGHWTIEVLNPDGTVASHGEFENSLQPTGAGFLSSLIARQSGVPIWNVVLVSDICVSPVSVCQIPEPTFYPAGISAPDVAPNLSVTTLGSSLVFGGSMQAGVTGHINSLYTAFFNCSRFVAPSVACGTTNIYNLAQLQQFTSFTPNSPIAVSAGQTVAVTVVVSFS
jgi:hypothetical protein